MSDIPVYGARLPELLKQFATKIQLPISETSGQILYTSFPINVSGSWESFKGSLIMAEDSVKQYLRHNPASTTAYITVKEIWPTVFFILLCDIWS